MMHLLIGAKPGLLSTFFSLVKKRLCSPELKHCLNVYSVVLCTLGCCALLLGAIVETLFPLQLSFADHKIKPLRVIINAS